MPVIGFLNSESPDPLAQLVIVVCILLFTGWMGWEMVYPRPSGEWHEDDYDVLADGAVVGRILKVHALRNVPDVDIDLRAITRGWHRLWFVVLRGLNRAITRRPYTGSPHSKRGMIGSVLTSTRPAFARVART
jgi:hypothetical protein